MNILFCIILLELFSGDGQDQEATEIVVEVSDLMLPGAGNELLRSGLQALDTFINDFKEINLASVR